MIDALYETCKSGDIETSRCSTGHLAEVDSNLLACGHNGFDYIASLKTEVNILACLVLVGKPKLICTTSLSSSMPHSFD